MTELNGGELRAALLAVPRSLYSSADPYLRLRSAEERAQAATRALSAAEQEIQRQAHMIALMLDELGGSLTISEATITSFDTARSIHTETDNGRNTFRIWVTEAR